MSGFLDDIIHREINENKSSVRNPSREALPIYIDGVEVGVLEIPPPPGWLIAIAIVGAAGTIFAILERIKRMRVRRE